MSPHRRAKTALVAAAGLGGVAATASGEPPPEVPAPTPPGPAHAANGAPARTLAARLSALPAVAVAHLARRADPRPRPRKRRRPGFTVVHVRAGSKVSMRIKPRGRVFQRVGARTPFGSKQTLAVAERRGRWLGVSTHERSNGRLAWVDGRSGALGRHRTRVSLRVDLSRRRLELRSGRRTLRSVVVGLGRPGSPTPTGRFAVTDKLSGAPYRGVYGCCILALSGTQERLPPGWTGGSRLAIHGGPGSPTSNSAGCVRTDRGTLRTLMKKVPLGTPVFVAR
jgi:hypothetical protein